MARLLLHESVRRRNGLKTLICSAKSLRDMALKVSCKLVVWLPVVSMLWVADASADLHDDIGYAELQALLGAELPSGAQTTIDQIEARFGPDEDTTIYLANQGLAAFPATQIVDRSGINSVVFSGHANSVAQRLGGVGSNSLLPALALIDGYEAEHWFASVLQPPGGLAPLLGTGTFANHSWVADAGGAASNIQALARMDWLVEQDCYFQAVGASNVSRVIFAYAMNVVVVKNSSATIVMSTNPLDNIYTEDRPAVHIVVPESSPSNATGVVSCAAALLQISAQPDSLSPMTIKAILMAGAERETDNTQNGNIDNYGGEPASNGLDYRYGAGQLNVLNNYRILSAGQQQNTEQQGGNVLSHGYEHAENFGASGETRTYRFETNANAEQLAVSLVWNLNINSSGILFDPNPVLYDLNLALYDVTAVNEELVAISASAIDNTENIWTPLKPFRHYEIRVSHQHPEAFSWPYALAWRQIANDTASPGLRQIPIMSWMSVFFLACLLYLMGHSALKKETR